MDPPFHVALRSEEKCRAKQNVLLAWKKLGVLNEGAQPELLVPLGASEKPPSAGDNLEDLLKVPEGGYQAFKNFSTKFQEIQSQHSFDRVPQTSKNADILQFW